MDDTTIKELKKNLSRHARALGIPEGSAELFIKHALSDAKKALKNKSNISEAELIRTVSKEMNKYSSDLAYVYKNYDKII